jgi:hypothetical protein
MIIANLRNCSSKKPPRWSENSKLLNSLKHTKSFGGKINATQSVRADAFWYFRSWYHRLLERERKILFNAYRNASLLKNSGRIAFITFSAIDNTEVKYFSHWYVVVIASRLFEERMQVVMTKNCIRHLCSITWRSDCRQCFGLEIGFIDHNLMTTLNHSAIANLHTLQITTAHAKSFQSTVTSRFPVTDLNNGDSSASVLNCTD